MKLTELFNQIPHYLTLIHEDYATDINLQGFPDFNPRYSKIVGTFEDKDIWASRYYPERHTFGIIDNDQIQSFVIIDDQQIQGCHPLVRLWTRGGRMTAGYVTALLMFILRKLQLRLLIKNDEPLTIYGCNWLVKLIQRKTVTALNASTKEPVSSEDIVNDFTKAKETKQHTSLAIILEGEEFNYPLFSSGYRTLSEMKQIVGVEEYL